MPTRFTHLCALLGLSFSTAATAAADHVVFVNDGAFEPKDLVISVGDTVTFKAFGNTYGHNVHAADESFRCSVGCRGDGSGASGDPAKEWTATVAFNTPKVVAYQCDPHYNMGMTAKITVKDAAAAGQNVVAGLSGNWNDPTPNKGGHGIQIEVLPNNGIVVLWFVFNPAGNAQSWIYTQGAYDPASNTVSIPAFLETGGAFPPAFDASKLSVTAWGTLTLSFTGCNAGTLQFAASDAAKASGYGDVSFPIQRVTSIANLSCP